ncbi:MAG TPA: hypothetical protein DHV15_11660 [Treponema sp.]|uniref:Uncharacterized protein n=1 Tax=Treponema denticola (strain ATCC 35405 / DSM 14222 / CIP 103919 / JCM 8153 / KCTC 15104) TaxID=243275 RepID=Q73MY2_TREDE|nr:hypothetical protein TDE_1374 [Treponema denticola ATCC 35405]HCY96142.1 hypothetical protein [Treponema sp.]
MLIVEFFKVLFTLPVEAGLRFYFHNRITAECRQR